MINIKSSRHKTSNKSGKLFKKILSIINREERKETQVKVTGNAINEIIEENKS